MKLSSREIRVNGRTTTIPAVEINGTAVVVTGGFFRTASVYDEMAVDGQAVTDPDQFIRHLRESGMKADLFTFVQQLPETDVRFNCPFDWDNVAAVRLTSFQDWWQRLPQESRKNTRRAAKRGVVARVVEFDDRLVEGIQRIYNETPMRQGKRFWHYGKDVDTLRAELATYLDRSEFIGAYFQEELVGFLKMVRVGNGATLFHILAMEAHRDKRPMNALVTKAVEICEQRGYAFFIYGQYVYGNKANSSLAEFKRRNGFVQINLPRYYVPLTIKGKVFVALKLYKGATGLLPEPVVNAFLNARQLFLKWTLRGNAADQMGGDADETESPPSATVARSEIG